MEMEPDCSTRMEADGQSFGERIRKFPDSKSKGNKRGGSEILIRSNNGKCDKLKNMNWWSSSELSIESTADKAIKTKLDRADSIDVKKRLLGADRKIDEISPRCAAESEIRFLKTKIQVLKVDVDRLFQDNDNLMKENACLEKVTKELAELKHELKNELECEQKRSEKLHKLYENCKTQIAAFVSESTTMKNDLDVVSQAEKNSSSTQLAVECRLAKAVEQIEKYKAQIEKTERRHKEAMGKERKKFEDLSTENARLQKQKSDLFLGFKKQMMLIDVLKKQKIHFEAASVLKFTEDEFIKLLDWKPVTLN